MAPKKEIKLPQIIHEEDFLEKEALKIGYQKMLTDLEQMLKNDVTEIQKKLLMNQLSDIKKRMGMV